MISWIQDTFQKHFRIVFAILLAVMTISLVSIYSASGGLGRGERQARTIEFFGMPLNSEAERAQLVQDGRDSHALTNADRWSDAGDRGLLRMAALSLADRLGVPQPTQDQILAYVQTLPAFRDAQGGFNQDRYTQFRDFANANPDYGRRLARIIAEDWRIAKVEPVLGGPGFVFDAEVKARAERAGTQWSAEAAWLDVSAVAPEAAPTEEQLLARFQANPQLFQPPVRMRVSFVSFRAADFAASAATPTEEELAAWFERNKARYRQPAPAPAEGQTPPPPAEPRLEDVREKAVADMLASRAQKAAENAAADLADLLYTREIKPGSEPFNALLEQKKLTLFQPPPFAQDESPTGGDWGPKVLAEAFSLGEKKPVSNAVATRDGAVLLFFGEKLVPSGDPEFASVRHRVLPVVTEEQRRAAVVARGQAVLASINAAMQEGKTFADAARAAGLEHKAWNGFTLAAPPADIDYGVYRRLAQDEQSIKTGVIAPMAVQSGKGMFLLVTKKQVPAVAPDSPETQKHRRDFMSTESTMLASAVLRDMVQKEADASGLSSIQRSR
jgi:peptidyl-prolyl cis-trans isomerase D